MTRIRSSNIQLGESFVVPIEQSAHNKKIQEALEKEKEIIALAEEKAQNIINEAQEQGQKIIDESKAQALSEVDAIKSQAYNEGFEAGRQEGYSDITNELTDIIIAVNDFAKSNFDIKRNIIKSANVDIINLVIEIAHKVCSNSLELDDNILKEITEKAIMSLKDKEEITIIVNPLMAEKIYAISDELKEKIPQLSSMKIIEDNSVSPDGTIVESPLSRVDSRVRSQINELSDRLMGKLNSTPTDIELLPEEQLKSRFSTEKTEEIAIIPQEFEEEAEVVEATEEAEDIIKTEVLAEIQEVSEVLDEAEVQEFEEAENEEASVNIESEEEAEITEETENVEDVEMTDLADSIEVFNSAESINNEAIAAEVSDEIGEGEEAEKVDSEDSEDVQG